jgi:hypothetical protein
MLPTAHPAEKVPAAGICTKTNHENRKEGKLEKDIPEMRKRLRKRRRLRGWCRLLFRVFVFRDFVIGFCAKQENCSGGKCLPPAAGGAIIGAER